MELRAKQSDLPCIATREPSRGENSSGFLHKLEALRAEISVNGEHEFFNKSQVICQWNFQNH